MIFIYRGRDYELSNSIFFQNKQQHSSRYDVTYRRGGMLYVGNIPASLDRWAPSYYFKLRRVEV